MKPARKPPPPPEIVTAEIVLEPSKRKDWKGLAVAGLAGAGAMAIVGMVVIVGLFAWPDREAAPKAKPKAIPEAPPAFVVAWADWKDTPDVQHQYRRIIVKGRPSRDQVAEMMQTLYSELRADILKRNPDARYKRISVWAYDSRDDFDEGSLGIAYINTEAGPVLPIAPKIDWHWRDSATEPSQRHKEVYYAYMKAWNEANKGAHIVEDPEKRALRARFAKQFNLTEREMDGILTHVTFWKLGEVMTPERIEENLRESFDTDEANR